MRPTELLRLTAISLKSDDLIQKLKPPVIISWEAFFLFRDNHLDDYRVMVGISEL